VQQRNGSVCSDISPVPSLSPVICSSVTTLRWGRSEWDLEIWSAWCRGVSRRIWNEPVALLLHNTFRCY